MIRESQNQYEFAENSSQTMMTKTETKSKAFESGKLISHIQLFSLLKIRRENRTSVQQSSDKKGP